MNNLPDQLNSALENTKHHKSVAGAPLEMAENEKHELTSLLELGKELFNLPKATVPTPLMNYKYAEAKVQHLWFAWLHISKFAAVSTSLMLLVSAFAVTGFAAQNSRPGQTLFTVKKLTEKSQVILAYDESRKASLQLEITQKRLNEAQSIFNDPASNLKQEQAALNELANQTDSAIAAINSITQNAPTAPDNHPLLASLETIAKQQQTLLEEITPNKEIQSAAAPALQTLKETSAKVSEIKQTIAVASNDQTLAKLKSDPNATSAAGPIEAINKTSVTVEKTVFTLTSDTIYKDSEGNNINSSVLKLQTKINISGVKSGEEIIAKEIVIPDFVADEPKVESASTTIATHPANEEPTEINGEKDPNQAVGAFILEDPAPQYAQ